jgi:hypothetical protein
VKAFASLLGDTVKLRGPPKAFTTKPLSKDDGGRVNSPGYSKSVKDVTMGNPQPSPKGFKTYGCSSTTRRQWVLYFIMQCLRYSLLSL